MWLGSGGAGAQQKRRELWQASLTGQTHVIAPMAVGQTLPETEIDILFVSSADTAPSD